MLKFITFNCYLIKEKVSWEFLLNFFSSFIIVESDIRMFYLCIFVLWRYNFQTSLRKEERIQWSLTHKSFKANEIIQEF